MFPGFDKDERWLFLEDLWLNSNLQFSGFYLKGNQWPQHWWDQRDTGWGLWPIWVPYNDQQILGKSPNLFSTYIGTMHGNQAFQMARDQKIEAGATIYLDLEAPLVSDEQFSQGRDYVEAWMTAIQNNDYAPGIYCSPVDVNTFLTDPRFQQFKVVLFPFAIAGPST